MSLAWKVVHFLWALQDMLHFFAFLFLVAIARYVAFKLLGTIAFFVPLQDMLHFRFWSLIAPCSIKITLFNKINKFIFHSTSRILWRDLLFHSVLSMAKSLIKLRALHGEKSVLRIMSIKALSLICLTLQLSGSLYPLPKTDPLSVLATQHLCTKSSQASS